MSDLETIDYSKTLFNNGFGCAEAVLIAIAGKKNIDSELIPRIATGFCGGMAKTNGMCGAVSGGVMAISLIHGRNLASEPREMVDKKIQQFIHTFTTKFGHTACTDLTGCDLSTEIGLEAFKAQNIHSTCTEFVGEATKAILEII